MKNPRRLFLWLPLLLFGLWMVYALVGHSFVKAAYEGRSIPLLNAMIQGQELHTLSHYTGVADEIMVLLTLGLCGLFVLAYFILTPWTANRIALVIGIIFCWGILWGAEWVAKKIVRDDVLYDRTFPDDYFRRDETGLRIPNPGEYKSVSISRVTKKQLYEVTYTIDEFGRRETPIKNKTDRDQFILFLGCSYTYGEGVEDHETLPAYVGNLTEKFMPYNYGFHGRGPHDVLALLDKIDFKKEIPQKNGIAVYTFMPDHINRTVGSMSIVEWNYDHVYYAKNGNNEYERQGTFETARPFQTRLYRFLKKSSLLKMLRISLPRITQGDIALTADLIQAAASKFLKQYLHGKFVIVIYPPLPKERHLCELMAYELKKRNMTYLYYDQLFNAQEGQYAQSKEDPHPSPLAYKLLAWAIVRDLRLTGNIQP